MPLASKWIFSDNFICPADGASTVVAEIGQEATADRGGGAQGAEQHDALQVVEDEEPVSLLPSERQR